MTTYTLDYLGPGHPIIGGIGQFGSYVREEVQFGEDGYPLTAPDGTPITKPVTSKYGPHDISADLAAQFDNAEMQEKGWVVIKYDSETPQIGEITDHGFIEPGPALSDEEVAALGLSQIAASTPPEN